MRVVETALPGVLEVEPDVFGDPRGFFLESWNRTRYEAAGMQAAFVQDNFSRSARGVLRGLHFQHPHAQGKLVSVLEGEVNDVILDIRRGSPAFGKTILVRLSAASHRQVWLPPGLAHGFEVLSEAALFHYKCTDIYHLECEGAVRWDDPDLGIAWETVSPSLSKKDAAAPCLRDIPADRLPVF